MSLIVIQKRTTSRNIQKKKTEEDFVHTSTTLEVKQYFSIILTDS